MEPVRSVATIRRMSSENRKCVAHRNDVHDPDRIVALDRHPGRSAISSQRKALDRGAPLAEQHVERRLAAVLAADVVGYSRLMAGDEEGTLARLNVFRRQFLAPTIAEHRGRIVKRTDDGLLIEFGSAIDATRCAVQTQQGMAKHGGGAKAGTRAGLSLLVQDG
jgi:class 3 adenylate cyclase